MRAARTPTLLATCLLAVGAGAGCSAVPSSTGGAPVETATSTAGPITGSPLTTDERAACDGKGYATLECLVAARARRLAGDEGGAAELLVVGCAAGDIEACLDAGQVDRVAELCKNLASTKENAVACQRASSPEVVGDERLELYKLAVKPALELRSKYGPALIAALAEARRACAPVPFAETRSASLEGSALAREAGLVDASILCPGVELAAQDVKNLKDGEGQAEPPVVRTLRDGFYRGGAALDVHAPVADGTLGVSCPSRLAADRRAVDVWLRVPTDTGEILIVVAVPASGSCLVGEAEKKVRRDDRAFIGKMLEPRRKVVTELLERAARACDGGMSASAGKRVGADPAAYQARAVDVRCEYGSAFRVLGDAGAIDEAGSFIDGHMEIDGLSVRTRLYTDGKKRALMTFRKRDATVTLEITDVPALPR